MIKQFSLLLGGLSVVMGASADIISPEAALQRAMESNRRASVSSVNVGVQPTLAFTLNDVDSNPAVYVFNQDSNRGFVVLSADDDVTPILGYSENGNISENNLPPQLSHWLKVYSQEIDYLRKNGIKNNISSRVADDREEIAPLVKTMWNQDAPYNDDCPDSRGQKTYTGCVATAMAQVVNYFEYPEFGEGSKSYICGTLGRLTLNFAGRRFDWDNMLDSYSGVDYTEDQASAVAYLMKACGYSVEMNYGTDASGAQSARIAGGLVNHFKYDKGIRFVHRAPYSLAEWEKMIYENLKNVGPVIYDGNSLSDGGHSFVCDGYDGNGYFHFNWGWGGAADGYFKLNALNPTTQGIGGSTGGFSYAQDAILGIKVPDGQPADVQKNMLSQLGALRGSSDGMQVTLTFDGWRPNGMQNAGYVKFRADIGVIIDPIDGTSGESTDVVTNYKNTVFSEGSYYSVTSGFAPKFTFPSQLSDGKYKVTLASRDSQNLEDVWTPTLPPYGYPNYIIIEKKGENLEVINIELPKLEAESAQLNSPCYYEYPVKIKATLSNPYDVEVTQGVSPALSKDGKICFIGDCVLYTLNPGEQIEEEWVVSFIKQPDAVIPNSGESLEYELSLIDPSLQTSYGEFGTVSMSRLRAKVNVRSRGFLITNAEDTYNETDGRVFVIHEGNTIDFEQKIEVVSGFFAYPVIARIYSQNKDNPNMLTQVLETTFYEVPFIEGGDMQSVYASVNFFNHDSDVIYIARSYYVNGGSAVSLAQSKFKYSTAGIDDVKADSNLLLVYEKGNSEIVLSSIDGVKDVKCFTADGKEISINVEYNGETASFSTESLSSGIAIIVASVNNGKQSTFKVAI